MATPSQAPTEAVFFFVEDHIAREMLYPEFEAILDGFVPMPEYAGKTARAAYLVIDSQLQITALVFFLIAFDARGIADNRWNLPLQTLVAQAAGGPDLGAGPIRLVCFSQCPAVWQRSSLWDPDMQPGRNSFVMLRKAVTSNRLGLIRRQPEPQADTALAHREAQEIKKALHQQYSQAMRDRLARLLKEQRLRITTINNRHQRQREELSRNHQHRLELYRDKVHQLQAHNRELIGRLETLKEDFSAKLQKIDGMREYFSRKLKSVRQDDDAQWQAMREHYELEFSTRLQNETMALEERLEMREMELLYRHQQESALKEEIARLRQENQSLLLRGEGHLLERLDQAGLKLVAFQPGVGPVTVSPDEVSDYLDNPEAFAAREAGVSLPVYRDWLAHCRQPECTASTTEDESCGEPLVTVGHPADFHAGESDRCATHQIVQRQRLAT